MSKTFNMTDLSQVVADRFGLTNQRSAEIVRTVFERVRKEVTDGKQVRLHDFGTFSARTRAAGVARNPSTGETLVVPKRRVVKLTVAAEFRKQVRAAT